MSILGHDIANIDLLTLGWAGLQDWSETVLLQVQRRTQGFERQGTNPQPITWDVLWD